MPQGILILRNTSRVEIVIDTGHALGFEIEHEFPLLLLGEGVVAVHEVLLGIELRAELEAGRLQVVGEVDRVGADGVELRGQVHGELLVERGRVPRDGQVLLLEFRRHEAEAPVGLHVWRRGEYGVGAEGRVGWSH